MTIHNPHDMLAKRFLTDLTVATDFLKAHLPEHIKKRCDFTTLRLEPTSYIEEDLRPHISDVLYSLKIDGRLGFIYILLETQFQAQKKMPLRFLRYKTSIWKDFAANHDDQPLPIIVPILLYTGTKSPYPFSTRLIDCFDDPELAQEIFISPIHLVDITVLSDETIQSHGYASLMETIQKHIHERDIFNLVYDIIRFIHTYPINHDLYRDMLQYVLDRGESNRFNEFFEVLIEQSKEYRGDTMTIAQQLEQRGFVKGELLGVEKGKLEGELEAKLQVAKNLLQAGIDFKLIEQATGLPYEELTKLSTKH